MSNKPKYLGIVCLLIILLFTGLILIKKFSTVQPETITTTNRELIKGVSIEKMSDEQLEALSETDPIDISEISFDQLVEDEYSHLFYIVDDRKRKVTRSGHPVERFLFSPTKIKFGYMEMFDIYDESIPWDREVVLHIGEVATGKTKELFHGSFKMSGWEWFSEDEVLIPYGCGTECEVLYLIDVNSGSQQTIQKGVGYQWSADKNWFSAYRYSGKLGIMVSNRNQDKIYEYLKEKEHDYQYNTLEEALAAYWAPESNRLAMIKEKENEDKLELIVVDFDQEGKILVQKDLGEKECESAFWYDDGEFICFREGAKEIIHLSN